MKILLIEDNQTIVKGLKYSLESNNYLVENKIDVSSAENYLSDQTPDLIILDITLPDGCGFDLYEKTIKDKNIPTIILTAIDDEDSIVKGIELGADEYITKPFSTKELLARINRILNKNKRNNIVIIDDIKYDLDKMEVYKNNNKIELTSLEIKLLNLLITNLNKTITRATILDTIWEITGNDVDDHTVTVYFKRIREKLDTDIIKTIKGIGYRIDYEK